VPNGISVEKYQKTGDRSAVRQQLGLAANAEVIGTVGRLVSVKNYPLLLKAFAQLATNHPDAHVVFIGDGPMREELVEQASRLMADDGRATGQTPAHRIHFLGHRDDVAELLPAFDIFVLCSHSEGHSIALLEAMAAGCPIVATAVGGNTELIQNEVTGLLVPSNDELALKQAITRLLSDPGQAHHLGKAARQLVEERYSIEHMVRRYEELYRRLVGSQ
jgi:glycosyltransferase involved in cell wall biosynthesis